MSRIIHTQQPGQTRKILLRSLAYSVRTYKQMSGEDKPQVKDILAFITLTLQAVVASVEQTIEAWERRGYWLKADRFRQQWSWASQAAQDLADALRTENWDFAQTTCDEVYSEVDGVSIPAKMRTTRPWQGAWEHWND